MGDEHVSTAYIKKTAELLCNAHGVGGLQGVCDTAKTLLSAYTEDIVTDAVGNLVATLQSTTSHAPTVLLEAHMDEIGFIVTAIDDKGFLQVAPCGGIDRRCVAAAPVTVWGIEPLCGVFCSVPPHLSKDKEQKAIAEDALRIDIGLSSEEAKKYVPLGTRVSYRNNFTAMEGNLITSKALDNRAGMTAVLYALSLLKGKALPYTLKILFACGEELGCRGAVTGAFSADADAALITDVSFAHTHDSKKENCGEIGKGAMLGIAPTLSYTLTENMQRIADKRGILYQLEAVGGKTGTDADVIGISRSGIPTVLLSVPLRYMHTPVETVDSRDIAAVGACMAAFIEEGGLQ